MTERDEKGKTLDLRVSCVLRNLVNLLYGSLESDIASYNLDREPFEILLFLYNKGPHPIQKISETFSIPSGSITNIVSRLENTGVVARLPILGDRSNNIITLTEEGRSYFDTVFPKHVQLISDNMSFVKEEKKLELIQVLKKISYGINKREDTATPQRMSRILKKA